MLFVEPQPDGDPTRQPGEPKPDEGATEKHTVTIKWDKGGEDVKVAGNWNNWELTAMEKGEYVKTCVCPTGYVTMSKNVSYRV